MLFPWVSSSIRGESRSYEGSRSVSRGGQRLRPFRGKRKGVKKT